MAELNGQGSKLRLKLAERLQRHLLDTYLPEGKLYAVAHTDKAAAAIERDLLQFERDDPERTLQFAFAVTYARPEDRTPIECSTTVPLPLPSFAVTCFLITSLGNVWGAQSTVVRSLTSSWRWCRRRCRCGAGPSSALVSMSKACA